MNKTFKGLLMFLNSVSLSYFTTWHHCNFSFELEKAVCSKVMSTAGVSEKSKSLHWAHLLSWVSVTAAGPLHTFLVIYKRREKLFARHFFLAYSRQCFHFKNQKAMKEPWIINNKNKPPLRRITGDSPSTYKKYSIYTTSPELLSLTYFNVVLTK